MKEYLCTKCKIAFKSHDTVCPKCGDSEYVDALTSIPQLEEPPQDDDEDDYFSGIKSVLSLLLVLFLPTLSPVTVHAFGTPNPDREHAALLTASIAEDVPYRLLHAICTWEGRGHLNHIINHHDNGSGSYGMCQVKVATAQAYGFTGNRLLLLEPETNAVFAARYLRDLLRRYKSWEYAIAAYNAGKLNLRNGHIRNIKYVRGVEKYL